METIYKYIKLPFSFDAEVMLREAQQIAGTWMLHYNSNDFTGEWKALPLRSIGGSTSNTVALAVGHDKYADTELMQQCPVIKSVIDSFQCPKTTVRLLNLSPRAVIKEHVDAGLNYEEGEVRIHIPLSTNDAVTFYLDDEAMKPMPGECWYMNFGLKHHLANHGDTDRIHLVIDGVVNNWVRNLFESCTGDNVKKIPAPEIHTIGEKRKIIEQLRSMGSVTGIALADAMEKELNTNQLS